MVKFPDFKTGFRNGWLATNLIYIATGPTGMGIASAIQVGLYAGVKIGRWHDRWASGVIPRSAESTAQALCLSVDNCLDDVWADEEEEIEVDPERAALAATFQGVVRRTRWQERHARLATRALTAAKLKFGSAMARTEANEHMVSEFVREWLLMLPDMRPTHAYAVYPGVVALFFVKFEHEVLADQMRQAKATRRKRAVAALPWRPSLFSASDGSENYTSDK